MYERDCQQSAEKFLKAFLVFHGNEIPKTHNIEFLLERCKIIDTSFSTITSNNLLKKRCFRKTILHEYTEVNI